MRLRRNPKAREEIMASAILAKEPLNLKGQWRRELKLPPEAGLNLEIGMGRGNFIVKAAEQIPHEAWLGLEFREEMIAYAILRLEGKELSNLRFIWQNALLIEELFAPGEISNLYLNFSDPWPKARHSKRRLTHKNFLNLYRGVLAPEGYILFKTDNLDFFKWSKISFSEEGWVIEEEDENSPPQPLGLITEYEMRYRRLGQPIYYLKLKQG